MRRIIIKTTYLIWWFSFLAASSLTFLGGIKLVSHVFAAFCLLNWCRGHTGNPNTHTVDSFHSLLKKNSYFIYWVLYLLWLMHFFLFNDKIQTYCPVTAAVKPFYKWILSYYCFGLHQNSFAYLFFQKEAIAKLCFLISAFKIRRRETTVTQIPCPNSLYVCRIIMHKDFFMYIINNYHFQVLLILLEIYKNKLSRKVVSFLHIGTICAPGG